MIYRLIVTNEQGEADEINTSPEHPFWVRDYGWLKAMYLEEGMTLVNEHDEPLRVQSLEKTENVDTVYNIEVEDWHTYFVGELAVWVHNACDVKLVNGAYLKAKGIDAHDLKSGIVGAKNMSQYDIYRNNATGELVIMRKNGVGEPIPTGEIIK